MGKVSDRTALTGANTAVGDLVPVVDVSATTSGSKKMTLPEFFASFPVVITTEMTGSGVAATDEYLISDAGVPKTITVLESANALWAGVATEMTGSGAASTDELLYSDAGVSKTITLAEFFATWPAAITTELTGAGVATTDEILVSDAGVPKTMTMAELFSAWPVAISTEILGSAVAATDELLVSDAGVGKTITFTELTSAIALLGFPLGDIPEYADQAAAATGLSGTGMLFRFATTGALGVTIT
jgi:hypothetical protein